MAQTTDIDPSAPPSGPGCVECDATSGWWFHLRRCAACGHVGCCDSSPSQHARHHARETGHRVARSYEPGEEWFWDFSASPPRALPGASRQTGRGTCTDDTSSPSGVAMPAVIVEARLSLPRLAAEPPTAPMRPVISVTAVPHGLEGMLGRIRVAAGHSADRRGGR